MLQSAMKKRKRWELPVMFLLVSMLLGCQNPKEPEEAPDSTQYPEGAAAREEPQYISETSKEDCLLCGDGKGTRLSLYKGEENIGVISLNTFNLVHVEINRYDDHGKMIEEPSQGTSMTRTCTGEGGFMFMAAEDTNRGYARCNLYFNEDEILDVEQAATHMCTECLNKAMNDGFGDAPTGMAVINFSTGEVRMLSENLVAFQFGDFYVSCESKKNETGGNPLEMDLLIFYCPKRYGD